MPFPSTPPSSTLEDSQVFSGPETDVTPVPCSLCSITAEDQHYPREVEVAYTMKLLKFKLPGSSSTRAFS